MNIKELITQDLHVPPEFVTQVEEVARTKVKIFSIPKRSGGNRLICQPSKKTKTIQYWLMNNVFCKLPVHPAAKAYRPGISILDNAKAHRGNRFFIRLDLLNFFPSISYHDLKPILERWHRAEKPSWALDDDAEDLIRKTCFYKKDTLPIGYPSSPMIANITMYGFDQSISELLIQSEFNDVIYTRYADDLIFSTNTQNRCYKIKNVVTDVINNNLSPRIQINPTKTRLGSSTGGTARVTGLKICTGGYITINRKQKDHIRLMLSLFKDKRLKSSDHEVLKGHLAYVRFVAPNFYTKLAQRYFKEIEELQRD